MTETIIKYLVQLCLILSLTATFQCLSVMRQRWRANCKFAASTPGLTIFALWLNFAGIVFMVNHVR